MCRKGGLKKEHGLGWILAAFFVVADMAGGGIVALPTAAVRCGFWLGLCFLITMAVMATTSAVMLGKAWDILLRRFPDYRTHCRKPYAEIGYKALGSNMKTCVSICVNFTQFGASTVFLLLTSKNMDDFLHAFYGMDVGFCIVIVVVSLFLLPITFLKSPQDFWPVVVGGMISTAIAVALIGTGALLDYSTCAPSRQMPEIKTSNALMAMGTILFTFGGHSAFPTIQHDMKRPNQFGKSAVLAFIIITALNLTAVILGGWTYGNSLRESVINSIQTFAIQQAVNFMITAHCCLTVILIINPLHQEAEEFFHIPQGFSLGRVVVRTGVMAAVVLMALTLPSFGHVLDLIGGSTVALTSVIFPCLFYLFLAAGEKKAMQMVKSNKNSEEQPVSFFEMINLTDKSTLFCCGIITLIGSIAGFVATVYAIKALWLTHFVPPCYLKHMFNSTVNSTTSVSVTNCCGPFQNITRLGMPTEFCAASDLKFY